MTSTTITRESVGQVIQTCRRYGVQRFWLVEKARNGSDPHSLDKSEFVVELAPGRSVLDLAGLEVDLAADINEDVAVYDFESLPEQIRGGLLVNAEEFSVG